MQNDDISQIKNQVSLLDIIHSLNIPIFPNNFIHSIYKQEHTPSLKIYPETNSFYCFATGKGGDAIQFYQDYCRISFQDAVKQLIGEDISSFSRKSIAQQRFSNSNYRKMNKRIIKIFASEAEYYNDKLATYCTAKLSDAESLAYADIMNKRKEIQLNIFSSLRTFCKLSEEAYDYLRSTKRKLTEKTIRKFNLFSVDTKTLLFLKDSFPKEDLILSGLFNEKEYFLLQRHSLVIPYIEKGKIVYLRGRFFLNGSDTPDKLSGKYMGLSNFAGNLTPKRFFNIDTLGDRSSKILIITEGEFDTMIADQHGAKAIGIPGVTNFPYKDLALLNGFDINLAFDNDQAGQNAMQKTAKLLNRPISILKINNGKDITEVF